MTSKKQDLCNACDQGKICTDVDCWCPACSSVFVKALLAADVFDIQAAEARGEGA